MSNKVSMIPRFLLPLGVFVTAFAGHFIWFVLSGGSASGAEGGCGTSCGTSCSAPTPSLGIQYLDSQSYFLGYSIALPLSFASFSIRQFLEKRSQAAKGAAIGGVSLSTFLGFAGCFMTGCCGSPMLGVYVSLLGANFLPFAKPLVAVISTLTIAASFWWLNRSVSKQVLSPDTPSSCCAPGTQCGSGSVTETPVLVTPVSVSVTPASEKESL